MQAKNQITIRKKPVYGGKYIIKIEGRVAWEGKNPRTKLPLLLNRNPGRNVSISWKPDREFLIV